MSKLLLAFSFILLTGCVGALDKVGVKSEYDEFDDETVYRSESTTLYGGQNILDMHTISVEAFTSCPGKTTCQPETYGLGFTSRSDGWRLLEHYPITFLIDGKRFYYSESEISDHHDVIYGGDVEERLYLYISSDMLREIAYSEELKFRVGAYDFEVPSERLRSIRMLLGTMAS